MMNVSRNWITSIFLAVSVLWGMPLLKAADNSFFTPRESEIEECEKVTTDCCGRQTQSECATYASKINIGMPSKIKDHAREYFKSKKKFYLSLLPQLNRYFEKHKKLRKLVVFSRVEQVDDVFYEFVQAEIESYKAGSSRLTINLKNEPIPYLVFVSFLLYDLEPTHLHVSTAAEWINKLEDDVVEDAVKKYLSDYFVKSEPLLDRLNRSHALYEQLMHQIDMQERRKLVRNAFDSLLKKEAKAYYRAGATQVDAQFKDIPDYIIGVCRDAGLSFYNLSQLTLARILN